MTDSAGQSSSKQLCLVAYYPTPQVVSVSPSTVPFDGQPHTITVTGTNFRSNAAVYPFSFSNNPVTTTFVNSTTLTFVIVPSGTTFPKSTYKLWIVQPYSDVSNMDQTLTIY
ncbi:MAG: IPT/TIG domain-containing protein [Acidobacteria bacterium]|nr:IPT/TIG domain-containing protein [Acidobacteriota bacterium]